jgi:hypothetical protein
MNLRSNCGFALAAAIGATFSALLLFYLGGSKDWGSERSSSNMKTKRERIIQLSSASTKNKLYTSGSDLTSGEMSQGRPERILAALAESDSYKRHSLLGEIARDWAKSDPDGCFYWAKNLSFPADRSSAIVSTLLAVLNGGDGDFSKVIRMIEELPKGEVRDDAIVYSFENLLKMNYSESIGLISSLSGEGAIEAVAKNIAQSIVASESLSDLEDLWLDVGYGTFRNEFAIAYAKELGKVSPDAAFDWLQNHIDFDTRDDAYMHIADAFAKSDPKRGIEIAGEIGDGKVRAKYLKAIGLAWGGGDPNSAGNLVVNLINEKGYDANNDISNAVLAKWIQWDHVAPFEKINEIQKLDDRKKAIASAVDILAIYDPKSAYQVLAANSDFSKDELIAPGERIAAAWLERDPHAASEWIGQFKDGVLKDAFIFQIVDVLLRKDGDLAMAKLWADRITSPSSRKAAVEKISVSGKNK